MKIIEKEAFTIVGMPICITMQNASEKCPKVWAAFMPRYKEISSTKNEKLMYGVSTGNDKDCRYTVGVESDGDVPEGMIKEYVPKTKFAVYEYKGKLVSLNETYEKIMKELGNKVNMRGVWLEVYDERFKPDSDDSIFEIWTPLQS